MDDDNSSIGSLRYDDTAIATKFTKAMPGEKDYKVEPVDVTLAADRVYQSIFKDRLFPLFPLLSSDACDAMAAGLRQVRHTVV